MELIFIGLMFVIFIINCLIWDSYKRRERESVGPCKLLEKREDAVDPEIMQAIQMMAVQKGQSKCRYCGAQLSENSRFCNICGNSQLIKLNHCFEGKAKDILYQANRWLADNPYIVRPQIRFETKKGTGNFTDKRKLRKIDITYEVADQIQPDQYAVLELIKLKGWGEPKADKILEEWKENNPNGQIILAHEYMNGHGSTHLMQIYTLVKFQTSSLSPADYEEEEKLENPNKLISIIRKILFALVVLVGVGLSWKHIKGIPQSDTKVETSALIENQNEIPDSENEQEDEPKQQYLVVTKESMLNIRRTPEVEGELIKKVPNGTVCEGTGNETEDGWIEIVVPDSEECGWANKNYLEAIDAEENTGEYE